MHTQNTLVDQGLGVTFRRFRGGTGTPRGQGYRSLNFGDKSTPEHSLTGRIACFLRSRYVSGLLQATVATRMRVHGLHQRRDMFGRRELADAGAEVEDVAADTARCIPLRPEAVERGARLGLDRLGRGEQRHPVEG